MLTQLFTRAWSMVWLMISHTMLKDACGTPSASALAPTSQGHSSQPEYCCAAAESTNSCQDRKRSTNLTLPSAFPAFHIPISRVVSALSHYSDVTDV